MPAFTDIPAHRIRIREGDPCFLMSRLINANSTTGAYLTNAAFSGGVFSWSLFDLLSSAPRTAVQTGTLTPISSFLSDTLITNDIRWTQDQIGYNWSWLAPASLFLLTADSASAGGDGEFRMEVIATPASGQPFNAGPFQISVAEMLSKS